MFTGRVALMLNVFVIVYVRYAKQDMPHESTHDEDHPNGWPAMLGMHSPMDQMADFPYTDISGCLCRDTPDEFTECYSDTCYKFPASLEVVTPIFKIVQTNIQLIARDDLLLFGNLTTLEIEFNMKLVKLEAGCFRALSKLTSLSIFCNFNLKHLEENVFEGLRSLSVLDMRKNGFTRITDITRTIQAVYLPSLKILELHENKFEVIEKYDFLPMNNTIIEQLNLIGCWIEYIHPECLAPLRYLNMIRLGRNFLNISTIGQLVNTSVDLGIKFFGMNLYDLGLRGTLPYEFLTIVGRSNMSFLYMAENHFDTIEDGSFPEMPNFLGLDLRSNSVIWISANAFRRLPRLETLLLSCNKLSTVPEGTLLPNLWELDFAENFAQNDESFFSVPDYIFENMTRLRILKLSGNNIAFLTNYSFVGLSNLTVLGLRSCALEYIESETFAPLTNLVYLNLRDNPLLRNSLSFDKFAGLESLKRLELSGCGLLNLTSRPSLFALTPNLIYLGLDHNGIKVIAAEQFLNLHHLQELHLYDNELIPWTNPLLNATALSVFDGGNNQFTYISTEMLKDWSTVNRLSLDGNPLSCDCSLYNMHLWVSRNDFAARYMRARNLTGYCMAPPTPLSEYLRNATHFDSCCKRFYGAQLLPVCGVLLLLVLLLIVLCYMFRWHLGYWKFLVRVKCQWRRQKPLKTDDSCRYDAFVSYCSADSKFVSRLVTMLEQYEPYLKLCMYERDFQVGSDIFEAVFQSVLLSRRTLLVVSDAFAKSQWCRWETKLAEYHDIFFYNERSDQIDDTLVVVKLEQVAKSNMTPTLRYLMKTRIYLEWDSDPRKERLFWMKLRHALAAKKEHFSDTSV